MFSDKVKKFLCVFVIATSVLGLVGITTLRMVEDPPVQSRIFNKLK
jgi:hypothetical protein